VAKAGRRPGPSQTRGQILRAARDLFAERGYARTSVRSVAAAGVSQGLVHHYFASKEQSYREALDLTVDPWQVLTRLLDDTPVTTSPQRWPAVRLGLARPGAGVSASGKGPPVLRRPGRDQHDPRTPPDRAHSPFR
jgi:AcrR family transcriptional regulator